MQVRPAYPVDAVGGSCFITGRYELEDGEQIVDLDRDTDSMPMYGRLCVSELAVRQMNACLGWEVDPRLQAKVAEQRGQLRELRAENKELRASLTSIGEALRAAGIVLAPRGGGAGVIAAVIILALALAVALAVVGGLIRSHEREREQWAQERRSLTDRVIARHIGEVIALDRNAGRPSIEDRGDPVLIEGLS